MSAQTSLLLPVSFDQLISAVKQLSFKEKKRLFAVLKNEVDKGVDLVIPEWHKKIVRSRVKKYSAEPSRSLDWDKVKNKFSI